METPNLNVSRLASLKFGNSVMLPSEVVLKLSP
jgi:hypothetical protein